MTESLWHSGGCRQDSLGTTMVYGIQESGESPRLGGGNVKSQVGVDLRESRYLMGIDHTHGVAHSVRCPSS